MVEKRFRHVQNRREASTVFEPKRNAEFELAECLSSWGVGGPGWFPAGIATVDAVYKGNCCANPRVKKNLRTEVLTDP